MKIKICVLTIFLVAAFYSNAQVATIDASKVKQVIDGFGASTAWHGMLSIPEAAAAFGNDNNNQLGLSIVRLRIDPNSAYWNDEKVNAQRAKSYGATVLASPWTPPASMKTNNNVVGGQLKADSYAAFATHLKNFCKYNGNVDVVSLQNEPNITVTYESCWWTPDEMVTFCRENAQNIGTPVMAPEAFNFDVAWSDPILNDSLANAHVSYIGGHIYGSVPFSYSNAISKGKKIWMTEHYYEADDIATCVTMGKEITDCMVDNMNAYVWWWLRQPTCNLMNTGGSLKKKGYAFAQFSKFIRPGYYRIDATYQPQFKIFLSAYKDSNRTVIVAVNQNPTPRTQTFKFKNDSVQGVQKYQTSVDKNLSDEGKISCTDNSFTDNLPAQSITTYVSTDIPTGLKTIPVSEIHIFPNPVKDYLQLSSIDGVSSIQILNQLGQQMVLIPHPVSAKIDISDFPDGMYFISIVLNGKNNQFKFLKIK